jgi:hypothetical protein
MKFNVEAYYRFIRILLIRLRPYAGEIVGEYQRGFNAIDQLLYSSDTGLKAGVNFAVLELSTDFEKGCDSVRMEVLSRVNSCATINNGFWIR